MRNDDHRILAVRKVIFQPKNCFKVKIIGRLIEKQIVRIAKQRLSKQHANFFLAVQIFHQSEMHRFFDTQSTEEICCVAFCIPAVHIGEIVLEFGGQMSVFFREIRFGI